MTALPTADDKPRVAVVTGAAGGLGRDTSTVLARRGYLVVVTARTLPQALQTAGELDGNVRAQALDVSSDASVAAFYRWLDEQLGRIDVLVSCAGALFNHDGSGTLDASAATILAAIDTNGLGAYRVGVGALKRMNQAGYGRIVNVSSGMGALTDMGSGHTPYRISKTVMNAVTILLAHEAKENVLVNAVCPGWVRTRLGGPSATRSLDESTPGIVWAATLPADGPNGGFFRDKERIAW